MVMKYTDEGSAYLWPPYSKVEQEYIDRGLNGGIIRYMRYANIRSRGRDPGQDLQGCPPEDMPPKT
jgi:hypothetical protein